MHFRYDFNENLDLSKFRKQSKFYISNIHGNDDKRIFYDLYLPSYLINLDIEYTNSEYESTVSFSEIEKDDDNHVIRIRNITPMNDSRFADIVYLQKLFTCNTSYGYFKYNVDQTVDTACNIIRLLSKVNNLKAFI